MDERAGAKPAEQRLKPRRSAGAGGLWPSRLGLMRRAASLRAFLRRFVSRFSSSLTRRIVFLNLGGLFALLVGFLYLNQFRQGLIDARIQSFAAQAQIIAAAIASSATVDADAITIDPEKLLKLAPGQSYGARPGIRIGSGILDQSRPRRPAAAPSGLADQDPRAHLRPRRLSSARFALARLAREHPEQ